MPQAGCPFIDFEECAKGKCKFYYKPIKEKCLLIAMADLVGKNNAILIELLRRSED